MSFKPDKRGGEDADGAAGLMPDEAMLARWQVKAAQAGSIILPEPLDIDLPLPNEDSNTNANDGGATGFGGAPAAAKPEPAAPASASESLFDLPTVAALESRRQRRQKERNRLKDDRDESDQQRIARKDAAALRARLELDPQADMLPETFQESFDKTTVVTAAVLGEAGQRFLFIEPGYLQAGHVILLLTSLLCAYVEFPGNPLTEFPVEIRSFLKSGMAIIYAINALLAASGAFTAAQKRQPVLLWAGKCFLLGGLAFDQINRAPTLPPPKPRASK